MPPHNAKVELAYQRIHEWEHDQKEKLTRQVESAHEELVRAERSVHEKLDQKR